MQQSASSQSPYSPNRPTAAAPQMRSLQLAFGMAILLTFILSGCLLERIFRVKDQLCDFENNFRLEINDGVRVTLLKPVLLDKDITWLTGAEPTEWRVDGNQLSMRYIVEKQSSLPNPEYDIPVQLRFVLIDGNYKLKEGYLSKNLTEVLTAELITQCIQSACKAEKSLSERRVTVDVTNIDRSLLPARAQVIELLGEPNGFTPDTSRMTYEYRLRTYKAKVNRAQIAVYFDEPGSPIAQITVRYLRYRLDVDFVAGKAVFRLEGQMKLTG